METVGPVPCSSLSRSSFIPLRSCIHVTIGVLLLGLWCNTIKTKLWALLIGCCGPHPLQQEDKCSIRRGFSTLNSSYGARPPGLPAEGFAVSCSQPASWGSLALEEWTSPLKNEWEYYGRCPNLCNPEESLFPQWWPLTSCLRTFWNFSWSFQEEYSWGLRGVEQFMFSPCLPLCL